MNNKKFGKIIVIEGLDKSGKTTQSNMLFKYLHEKQQGNVVLMSFPDYSTRIGKEIKAFLEGSISYNNETKHILMAANRWEKKQDIENLLMSGKTIVMNRYYQSNLAYGLANGLDINWLKNLEKGLPKEDVTLILDIFPEISLQRLTANNFKPDEFERNKEFLNKARNEYLRLARIFDWKVVSSNVSKPLLFNEIIRILGV
ncbi:dTMP kinase [Candidatus Nitrosocosmicus franklandus]|uniref:Probable thymidylate kinase n=1 Tax=Candidatus Nitrosocosmicus franklandianus TaxID=1798806 RepID=A0A484I715_9ARCH|nr:dTMP kinase [Candidatus Nitrosocosmicus franklandus]VFJ12589.1 putative thymidylate kinase [Candidatus Nitrosocosmicus franklandus]